MQADERGFMLDCDKLRCLFRKKGSISGNHSHEVNEILYLIQGEAELTVDGETETIVAPVRVDLPAGTWHTVVALTDIILLEDRPL